MIDDDGCCNVKLLWGALTGVPHSNGCIDPESSQQTTFRTTWGCRNIIACGITHPDFNPVVEQSEMEGEI
jgi:hypothetical protein